MKKILLSAIGSNDNWLTGNIAFAQMGGGWEATEGSAAVIRV